MSELQLKTRNLLIRAAVDRTGTHFFRLHREFAACEANFNLIEATGDEKLLDLTEIKNWEAIAAELGPRLAAAEKPAQPAPVRLVPPVVVPEPKPETEEERVARLQGMSAREIREQLVREHDERVLPKDQGHGINPYTMKPYLLLPAVDPETGAKIDRRYIHRMPTEQYKKFQMLYGDSQLEQIYNQREN